MNQAQEWFTRQHPDWRGGWAMTPGDAPAFWNVGTYWRLLSPDAGHAARVPLRL